MNKTASPKKGTCVKLTAVVMALYLSLCACGGNSSGAPADEPAGTADDEAQSTKSVDAKENTPPEKRLKEVRIVADGTDVGALMYTYDDKGTPIRLEATNGLSELLDWYSFDYEYDAEGRLTCAKWTDEDGDTYSEIIQYRQEDGITRAVLSLDEDGDGVPDEANERLKFTFDADGYMLSLSSNDDETTIEWTYDDAHRVTEVYINDEYSSDALSIYTYDDNGNLIEECYYVFDPDELPVGTPAGEGLRPDKSTATSFSQTTYSDLKYNDKGLLTSKDGEERDSDGDAGDVSIDYTYDDEGNLLLERKTRTYNTGKDIQISEATIYHSGNDACRVRSDKTTYYDTGDWYSGCEILSDQFAFWSYDGYYNGAGIRLPFGGSIRFIPPESFDYFLAEGKFYPMHDYYEPMFPGIILKHVFYDALGNSKSYEPANLEFTEDGYLSKLDYGAENYVEFIYETAE